MKSSIAALFLAVGAVCLAVLPEIGDPYILYIANLILAYVVVSIGFNILLGFAGQFAFASAAFMGIGAYTLALLMSRLDVNILVALPASGLAAAILGGVAALPSLRMKTVYLAMVTMAFAEIVQWVLVQWKDVTLGTEGVSVPFPKLGSFEIGTDEGIYYMLVIIALGSYYLARRTLNSWIGRSLVAIRENEIAAKCNGVNVPFTKAIAFCLSAFFSGIGGAMFALSLRYIVPDGFGVFQLTVHFSMVLIGGLGSLLGSVLGALLLTSLPELLRGAQAYQEIIYGGLLMLFVIFLPDGLAGLLRRWGVLPREVLVHGWKRFAAERSGATPSLHGRSEGATSPLPSPVLEAAERVRDSARYQKGNL
jgi:branched-chain amino acid transport system permease protein